MKSSASFSKDGEEGEQGAEFGSAGDSSVGALSLRADAAVETARPSLGGAEFVQVFRRRCYDDKKTIC
jgi:hypothetical protein